VETKNSRRTWTLPAAAMALASLAASAQAVTLTKSTFSGSGANVGGGSFRLGLTVGEAGVVGQVAGGSFQLIEGFWLPNLGGASSVVEAPDTDPDAPQEETVIPHINAFAHGAPNPFHGATTFAFSLAQPGPVTLTIYDVGGRRVRSLLQDARPAGPHQLTWDGRDDGGANVASGVYLARLSIGTWTQTQRLVRVR